MKRIILVCIIIIPLFFSCNNNTKETPTKFEAWNSGELTIYYDNTLTPMLDTVFKLYQRAFPNIKSSFVPVTSREGMALLLNGKSRVLLQSRNYLKDEDSLKKAYNVNIPEPWEFAEDALVFFIAIDNPIDTMNARNIEKYFHDFSVLSKNGVNLEQNPEFVITEVNSSIYSNFREMVLKNGTTQRRIKTYSSVDSVKAYVASHKNSIGIAYLSHVNGDLRFKSIPLGYFDKKNDYVNPKPVHQAFIVQGLYPYIIKHRIFLLEDKKDIALWFATFLSKESFIQKYFKDYGIVPSYAKIVLIKEE
jgi:ABC-type phosphate transport system substrate-binding protein